MKEITLNINEVKEDIGKALEHIFLCRRIASDLEFDVEEIDLFIKEYGEKQMHRFDNMTNEEIVASMVNDIVNNLPDELVDLH